MALLAKETCLKSGSKEKKTVFSTTSFQHLLVFFSSSKTKTLGRCQNGTSKTHI
jgi:hypothetical protein